MTDFQVVCLKGVFGRDNGPCLDDVHDGTRGIREILEPFIDRNVQVHLHYDTPLLRMDRPNQGCCLWNDPHCPVHSVHPELMLAFDAKGILRTNLEEGRLVQKWWVEPPLGGPTTIIPFEMMPFHYGRLMVTTILGWSGVDSRQGGGAKGA